MDGSTWLVLVAMVAAVNPLRLHRRLPDLATTTLGAIASAAAYTALGLVASGLLGAIDVSAPTMRIAAGLALVLGAARDVVMDAPAHEPALAGRLAAIVPVALPMLARPHVGVLAISMGATEGVWTVAVGAALVILAAAGVSVAPASPHTGRVASWGAFALAVIAAVCGISLAVDGVLAV